MPNAIEEALKRANDEKRAQIDQTIENAQQYIDSAKMQMANAPSGDLAAVVAQNEQVIAEARRSIPVETMQSVDNVSPPMSTPPMHGNVNPEPVSLNPEFKSTIENIEQGSGNNYLNQNAVDRALKRENSNRLPEEQQHVIDR